MLVPPRLVNRPELEPRQQPIDYSTRQDLEQAATDFVLVGDQFDADETSKKSFESLAATFEMNHWGIAATTISNDFDLHAADRASISIANLRRRRHHRTFRRHLLLGGKWRSNHGSYLLLN